MDDEGNGSHPPPKDDGIVVLTQPAANPSPTPTSNFPAMIVDVENQKDDGNPADAPAT